MSQHWGIRDRQLPGRQTRSLELNTQPVSSTWEVPGQEETLSQKIKTWKVGLHLKNNTGGWFLASVHFYMLTYKGEHVHTYIHTQTKHIQGDNSRSTRSGAPILPGEDSRAVTDLENLFLLCFVFVTNNSTVFCVLNSNLFWCLWLSHVCLQLSIWLMLQIIDSWRCFSNKTDRVVQGVPWIHGVCLSMWGRLTFK